jgi:hypothetical protein
MSGFATLGAMSLDGIDAAGVKWTIAPQMFSGWDDGTASTISVLPKPRQDGGSAGAASLKPGHFTLGGTVRAPSVVALLNARDRLKAACTLDDTVLTVTEGGVSRWATVRREDEVLFKRESPTVAIWSVQLVALDSRKYGAQLLGSTGLPSSSGGFSFPMTFPFSINATQNSGLVSLTNPGNAIGPVLMRVNGPGAAPIITHMGTGIALVFSASAVLGVGEFWTIDMENHRVLAQGQSGRSGYITSRGWSGFDPGVNIWSLSAPTFSAMTLDVMATPAWQ